MRTCTGCRKPDEPEHLLRLIVGEDGTVVADLARRGFGRGAWVHPRPECLARAPRGLGRALKMGVKATPEDLAHSIRAAAARRVAALIGSAKASGKLAIGSDAVHEALQAGRVALTLLAVDARAAATPPWIAEQVALGRVVAWGTKQSIGELLGRGETAVLGVQDRGLADALSGAMALAHIAAPAKPHQTQATGAGVEVR